MRSIGCAGLFRWRGVLSLGMREMREREKNKEWSAARGGDHQHQSRGEARIMTYNVVAVTCNCAGTRLIARGTAFVVGS